MSKTDSSDAIIYRARANTDATILMLSGTPIALVESPGDDSLGYYQEIPEGKYVRNPHEGCCWYVEGGELHATRTEPTHLVELDVADGNQDIAYYGDDIADLLGIEAPESDDADEDAP